MSADFDDGVPLDGDPFEIPPILSLEAYRESLAPLLRAPIPPEEAPAPPDPAGPIAQPVERRRVGRRALTFTLFADINPERGKCLLSKTYWARAKRPASSASQAPANQFWRGISPATLRAEFHGSVAASPGAP